MLTMITITTTTNYLFTGTLQTSGITHVPLDRMSQ